MSHNKITSLGSQTCPLCFSNTVQSQLSIAARQKPSYENTSSSNYGLAGRKPKPLFPKLEVLVLSHNGKWVQKPNLRWSVNSHLTLIVPCVVDLASVNDLHIHAMPKLQTILCNCNNITSLNGFDDSSTIKAIVLDKNKIRDVPFNCLVGCKSLRYLHLEHNRLTSLPRIPHLQNLAALHIGYNKILVTSDISLHFILNLYLGNRENSIHYYIII